MRTFRLILTLLLCLTVPVAGWASVLNGPLCPQLHEHGTPAVADHDHDGAHPPSLAASESAHHHEHCGGIVGHGKPCKGDHCACGCGVGACSSSVLSLLAFVPTAFTLPADLQSVPPTDTLSYADTRGASPLRPPIS